MNLGLSFIAQVADDWARQALTQLRDAITVGYHQEHNADDTHKTITATGAISERARTTPMGVWIQIPFRPTDFTGSGTMAWGVDAADVNTLKYSLVGTTMTIAFYIFNTSVTAPLSSNLQIQIPGGFRSGSGLFVDNYWYIDNGGARTPGLSIASADKLILQTGNAANWTASANNTSIYGSVSFEVAPDGT